MSQKLGKPRKPTVAFVTDPMCSWCWGMASDIDEVIAEMRDELEFDVRLGGINTDSTRPVGEYGRWRLDRLWSEVSAVTGQTFSHRLADGTVYNSVLPCLALEAARELQQVPPFGFTHRLQQRFFVESVNINDRDVLCETASELGLDSERLAVLMDSAEVRARTRWGFETARRFGTNALPSVLVAEDGIDFRLFAGGYVSAEQLVRDLRRWLADIVRSTS